MKALTATLVSLVVCGGALAQAPDTSGNTRSGTHPTSAATRDAAVEKRIADLHTTLKITPAQESQWREVASTMRENVQELDQAIDKRAASAANATAIDDLNAYAAIAQAHADGVRKLSSAFAGLYGAMSDDQKKTADEVFSHRGRGNKLSKNN